MNKVSDAVNQTCRLWPLSLPVCHQSSEAKHSRVKTFTGNREFSLKQGVLQERFDIHSQMFEMYCPNLYTSKTKHIASLTARGGGRSVWNEEASNFSIINFQVDVIFQRMEVEAIELPWPSSLRVRRSCCRASPPGLPQSFPVCWAQTVEVRCLCPSSPPSSSLLLALLSRLSLPHILQVNNMMRDIFLVFPLNLPSAK